MQHISGQIDRALKIIPNVLKELPEAPSINFAIANMYGKISRYQEAETHFIKAIKLYGKEVKAIHYANLGENTIFKHFAVASVQINCSGNTVFSYLRSNLQSEMRGSYLPGQVLFEFI